jgi:hypothetical protein
MDDLADLVSPKIIVYCEGRAEPSHTSRERGLDAQVFNNVFGAAHPDTLFVSSGGNTELDQRSTVAISILGKVFPAVEILVLKDRDMASGKDADEKDRQVYLNTNPYNHRVLKRREIENYLYDKGVLQAYCIGEGLAFDEVSYDEFVTDIYNQNLKDEANRIKNFCGIKSSINAEVFKLNLSNFIAKDTNVYRELRECVFERK